MIDIELVTDLTKVLEAFKATDYVCHPEAVEMAKAVLVSHGYLTTAVSVEDRYKAEPTSEGAKWLLYSLPWAVTM